MPTWAFVLTIVLGIIAYIAMIPLLGMWMQGVLDRCCAGVGVDRCSHYGHDAQGICFGLIWPISMIVFTIWYLIKYTPSIRFLKV